MFKAVVYNKDFEVLDILKGIKEDYDYTLTSVTGHKTNYMEGMTSPFIIVREDRPLMEITKEEVISFMLESVVKRLMVECDRIVDSGFHSSVKDASYAFSQADQANFTQQLTLLLVTDAQEVIWRTRDKGLLPHTREEFIDVCKDGEKHKRKWIGNLWTVEHYLRGSIKEYDELFQIGSLREEMKKIGLEE